jgi:hypothetical protein
MKRLLLAASLIAATFAADAGNYTCQIDRSAMYATGQTRIDSATGTLLWEYKCPMGHTYWITPMSPNADSTTAPPAPPAQQPDYSFLHNAGKQQMEDAGRGLGAILGNALHKKQAKSFVLIVKCEHYVTALISYDDGSLKTLDLTKVEGSNAVDRTELAAYQTALPNLHVVEGGCE